MRCRSLIAPTLVATCCGFVALAAGGSFTPINDLGTGLYLNQYQGGLYPNGSNVAPAGHASVGTARAGSIGPLNTLGQPDPNGKFVVLSVGMSNTAQEYAGGNVSMPGQPWTFMGQAASHPAVNHSTMVLFNGARGGQTSQTWDQPTDSNYNRVATDLQSFGLSEAQVRVAWLKTANAQPNSSLPNANADANMLVTQMGNIVRSMKVRYPNLETVFISSRIYAGYATTTLNPEPYAYEGGFAVKRVIEAQINEMNGGGTDPLAGNLDYTSGAAPWIAWGPYTWADGLNPRSDGLTWAQNEFAADGTHPSQAGQTKVGRLLMQHMINSPFAEEWFLSFRKGDANLDGSVNLTDFDILAANFGLTNRTWTQADFTYDGRVNLTDFDALAGNFGLSASPNGPTPGDWTALAAAVPEPALSVFGVLLMVMLPRRLRGAGRANL
jgi:hypothetical protein